MAYVPSCPVVFMPSSIPEGCVFADPRVIDEVVEATGGSGGPAVYGRQRFLREDEEILAVIMAYTLH